MKAQEWLEDVTRNEMLEVCWDCARGDREQLDVDARTAAWFRWRLDVLGRDVRALEKVEARIERGIAGVVAAIHEEARLRQAVQEVAVISVLLMHWDPEVPCIDLEDWMRQARDWATPVRDAVATRPVEVDSAGEMMECFDLDHVRTVDDARRWAQEFGVTLPPTIAGVIHEMAESAETSTNVQQAKARAAALARDRAPNEV